MAGISSALSISVAEHCDLQLLLGVDAHGTTAAEGHVLESHKHTPKPPA
jgi:hypothetical protein